MSLNLALILLRIRDSESRKRVKLSCLMPKSVHRRRIDAKLQGFFRAREPSNASGSIQVLSYL